MATTSDFGEECREAFVNHCVTLSQIDLNAWGNRNANRRKRDALLGRIDDVLDVYLSWVEIEPLERELAS